MKEELIETLKKSGVDVVDVLEENIIQYYQKQYSIILKDSWLHLAHIDGRWDISHFMGSTNNFSGWINEVWLGVNRESVEQIISEIL